MSQNPFQGPTAADALAWMHHRASGGRTILFRGQSRIHLTIPPSLYRAHVSKKQQDAWLHVMRYFVSNRRGLTGYAIRSPHDAVAIVQHYLVRSPVIDLTGMPDVALYFALLDPSSDAERVVYAVDVEKIQTANLWVTDHAFITLPLEEGGKAHRWLRQDGFTIGLPDWMDFAGARALDLLKLPGVDSFTFKMRPGEDSLVAHLGDLETVRDDPLAASVRGVFQSIAQRLGRLDDLADQWPSKGTVDPFEALRLEIKDLIANAGRADLSQAERLEIDQLLEQARPGFWGMDWEAALTKWTDVVNARAQLQAPGA